jgi:signal transduction histidine kinase
VQARAQTKILVVNDDPASLLALTSLLETWADELGYGVVAVPSGFEALRQVLLHDFAMILLDVNMPGMSGLETADAIRQHPRSAVVPIVFITAYQLDELDRLRAYEQGAADFLFTPVIPQVLRAKVAVFIALRQKNEALRAQAAELRQRTEELAETNVRLVSEIGERRAAERANHAKDEFLAMLGHELRNPLSAIGGAASLLGMPAITPDIATRARDIVQRQTRQLGSIVDDLLDLSRAMSGKIVLARRAVDLAEIVATSIGTFVTAGRLAGHSLRHDLEPCWVDGDPTRLEQIASNLIDNAIKYTPPGGRIEIAVAADGDDAVLAVSDDGIGISPDLLPQVFDLFVQEAVALDRSRGGLGIGLSLVRRLVELHGGSNDDDSRGHGLGTRFEVRLPPVPAPARVPAAVRTAAGPAVETSVLLIDDNDDGREMLALALAAHGCAVHQAGCGMRGIDQAVAHRPRVGLIDIGLPGIDGYEVARRLRRDPSTASMHLVALTGYGLAKDQEQALRAGFDLHLVKPVDIRRLVGIIRELEQAGMPIG